MSFPYKKILYFFNSMQRAMFVLKMWFWVCLNMALILCLTLNDVSEAKQAMLVGKVFCDPCFSQIFSESSHFISGALVAVECGDAIQTSSVEPRFRAQVKTDELGEFRVKLPFSVSKYANKIDGCLVKLISSSESDCAVAATTTPSPIRLMKKTPENHVFTAGSFTFRPLEQQKPCQIKATNWNSNNEVDASQPLPVTHEKENTMELDKLVNADAFGLPYPPNPFRPPPPDSSYQPPPDSMFTQNLQTPPPDSSHQPPPDSMLTQNLQPPPPDSSYQPPPDSMLAQNLKPPPPSMFTPIPFQPPSPSMFTPIPFQPPPASMFSSIPFLQPPPVSIFGQLPFQPSPPSFFPQLFTPPPPPPPPSLFPSLQFPPVASLPNFIHSPSLPSSMPPLAFLPPFPPFPFQPTPGFPGMPPATSSAHIIKSSSP